MNLGKLPGGFKSLAEGINRNGSIVGLADDAQGMFQPVMFRDGQVIRLKGMSGVRSINDSGQIAGSFEQLQPGDYVASRACLFSDGIPHDLGTVLR